MIPPDADPIAAPEVAQILGVSLTVLRNRMLADEPGLPRPLNPHRGRSWVWDRAEVEAYAAGQPPAPRPEPGPDDLLDDTEAAAAVGVSVDTFTRRIGRVSAQPRSIDAHELRYWRRGDLARRHQAPPGKVGRPAGAKDLAPRPPRGESPRIAETAAARVGSLKVYLAQLAAEGMPRPGSSELAAHYDVTPQTIRRWLARIEQDAQE